MKRRLTGFTLIEVLIALAIVGILTAIALPQYRDYVTQARLMDAVSGLSAIESSATNYWRNNGNTYVGFDRLPATSAYFTYTLESSSATAMSVKATGKGNVLNFNYFVDQDNKKSSNTPYGNSTTCWVIGKGGKCSE